jgi:hypothetical protein
MFPRAGTQREENGAMSRQGLREMTRKIAALKWDAHPQDWPEPPSPKEMAAGILDNSVSLDQYLINLRRPEGAAPSYADAT